MTIEITEAEIEAITHSVLSTINQAQIEYNPIYKIAIDQALRAVLAVREDRLQGRLDFQLKLNKELLREKEEQQGRVDRAVEMFGLIAKKNDREHTFDSLQRIANQAIKELKEQDNE